MWSATNHMWRHLYPIHHAGAVTESALRNQTQQQQNTLDTLHTTDTAYQLQPTFTMDTPLMVRLPSITLHLHILMQQMQQQYILRGSWPTDILFHVYIIMTCMLLKKDGPHELPCSLRQSSLSSETFDDSCLLLILLLLSSPSGTE
jgi:hypothetical protein